MTIRDGLTSSTASVDLVMRFQVGDDKALERLWKRYLPRLRKWAHGRLPRPANAVDTDDLVQDAFVRSLAHLRTLKPEGPQSIFTYFKTILLNLVRDYVRQARRRPMNPLDSSYDPRDATPSPLEELIGLEALERYQRGLAALSNDDQYLVLAIVELGLNDREIAELFEKPTVDAARMARGRALARLARAMQSVGT